MNDEPQDPIEILGEKIMRSLPKGLQNEKVAYGLGSLLGFVSGWFVGRTVIQWLFPDDKGEKK